MKLRSKQERRNLERINKPSIFPTVVHELSDFWTKKKKGKEKRLKRDSLHRRPFC